MSWTTRAPEVAGGDRRVPLDLDVLVVDDNQAVRTSLGFVLRSAGYQVGEAEDGLIALTILSSTRVGVVVLDLRMPRLGGLGLLYALPQPPPVVLLSAHDYDGEVMRRRSKVFAFAQKPIAPTELRSLVEQALSVA